MANSRFYSSVAQQTTLTGGVTPSGTSIAVASTAGFPGSLPYTLALDYGSSNEELVEVTGQASLTLTVTRAIDGTSGSAHSTGAFVRHVSSARDFTDSRTHEAATTNVHGLTGGAAVVGTTQSQTLTNKTLTKANGSLNNATFFNTGVLGITQIIGDSANPNASRLEIKDNELALNTMLFIRSNGNIGMVKNAADTDSTYRVRLTESDQTTDRFAVLAGGTMSIVPNSTTGFVPLDIVAPDTLTTKRSIRVAASGGGTERFTVWNDGRVDIVGSTAGVSQLDVFAAPSQSTDIMRVQDSSANTLFSVMSTGKALANKGAIVAQPGVTSGAVMQVGGSNVGYTGNLEQWVSPANAIVASINETGVFNTAGGLTVSGGIGQVLFVKKTADTSRASTITATDDPHLVVAVSANATYELSAYIIYNANVTGDFGMQFGVPAGTTGDYSGTGWGRDATASVGTAGWTVRMNQNTITQNRTYGGDTTDLTIHVKGIVVTAGTSGNFSFQWAQAVSDAGATIVRTPSYMVLRRVA